MNGADALVVVVIVALLVAVLIIDGVVKRWSEVGRHEDRAAVGRLRREIERQP